MFSICRVLYLLGKTGQDSSELGKKAAQRSEQGTRQDSGRTAKSDRWLERASEGVGQRKWVGSGLSSLEGTSRAAVSLGRERIQNTHGGILQGPLSPKSCVCICAVNRAGRVRMKWRGRQGQIPRGFMYCMVSFTFIFEERVRGGTYRRQQDQGPEKHHARCSGGEWWRGLLIYEETNALIQDEWRNHVWMRKLAVRTQKRERLWNKPRQLHLITLTRGKLKRTV